MAKTAKKRNNMPEQLVYVRMSVKDAQALLDAATSPIGNGEPSDALSSATSTLQSEISYARRRNASVTKAAKKVRKAPEIKQHEVKLGTFRFAVIRQMQNGAELIARSINNGPKSRYALEVNHNTIRGLSEECFNFLYNRNLVELPPDMRGMPVRVYRLTRLGKTVDHNTVLQWSDDE